MHSLLIDYKIDVKNILTDTWKFSPLYVASGNGWIEGVNCLIKNSADVNKGRYGITPLYIATENGHFGVVKCLIKRGAVVDKTMNNGATPLHVAAYNGHLGLVKFLIKMGANVNSIDINGTAPLYCAATYGHESVVQYLLKRGGSISNIHEYVTRPTLLINTELLILVKQEYQRLLKESDEINASVVKCLMGIVKSNMSYPIEFLIDEWKESDEYQAKSTPFIQFK